MTTTASTRLIETRNPATGEVLRTYERHGRAAIDARLDAAVAAQRRWRETPFEERADRLRAAAEVLRARRNEWSAIMTAEMGKPIVQAEAEVEKCAVACDWFAANGAGLLANEDHPSNATRSYAAFRPLGVLLAIMPWNFPFWQVFRAAAPALMAGNTIVLKHASNVTGSALAIEEVFRGAGFPNGAFTTLIVGGSETEPIVLDPRVAATTLTGSSEAGAAVGTSAAKAIKKTVLELGGSDYFIVLADADLEGAARVGVRSRYQNTGQSCIAAKRFIIEESVYDRYVEAFLGQVRALKVGDPTDRETQIGPLARFDLRDTLAGQVRDTVAAGAKLLFGGNVIDRPGAYYAPTVVADVVPGMRMASEETFGPAAAMMRARDAEHAVELANDTRFGLGGNLWTQDISRAERFAADLQSGNVFINGMTASDPRLPFGGVKQSGYGRELAEFGIREFVNIQTVWIGPDTGKSAEPPTE
jgi:acyl-CoA reductase-like NAD-dependent aldehyde dehydrogenase